MNEPITGVIGIYLVTGRQFNMLTAAGVIMLPGIAVNNGTLLVEHTNLLRSRGMSVREARIEA